MEKMYNNLKHYGRIIADKNHETTEGHFIRFTTWEYNDNYYISTKFDGMVVAISEINDVHNLLKSNQNFVQSV